MGLGVVTLLLFGDAQDTASLGFSLKYVLLLPPVIFGIPFVLGALFFDYCVRKLKKTAGNAR